MAAMEQTDKRAIIAPALLRAGRLGRSGTDAWASRFCRIGRKIEINSWLRKLENDF